ncbi:putative F-box/FBD/LRR-repeat protein At1g78760 [Lathyrus oleraceus]|uniref:F-box domain-containing protein n=1 Tax=Pisum sativum TaxID=3888 RepID=A0A9D5BAS3_PEA|nr:putative F-box/FBD/LRR-repeat protein At1g78760 [Pisum sativum]XP_050904898.1 putative F-box/FBD/LRR-repeat protein At1g78760 [Pisum sativum]KAI5435564.1 hypothetical protein KIW84_022109 [Pisum sativum]
MKTRRRNYDKDRMSDLPDSVLLEILSNLKINQAVEMSILSTRWKNLWKYISVLSLHYRSFKSIECFINFVSQFFSFRNEKTSVQALTFECRYYFDPLLLKRILKYLFSHNVQHLDMTVPCTLKQFPLSSNFSYHSLTSLKLSTSQELDTVPPVFPNSLKLPALTNLSLYTFTFRCTNEDDEDGYADPFSGFQSLNTLFIESCPLFNDKEGLFISSLSLVSLTILLPIDYDFYKFKLSTPNLSTFHFAGRPFQNLSGHNNITNFSFIKHVNIHIPLCKFLKYPSPSIILFDWLLELHLMESFTISSNALQILNSVPDSWKIDFPYLHNLKLLKIITSEVLPPPNGTEDFLLRNSPSAKKVIFPETTLKEIIKQELRRDKQLLKRFGHVFDRSGLNLDGTALRKRFSYT